MSSRTVALGALVTLQRGYDLPESDRRPGPVPVIGSAGVTGYHDVARVKGPGVTVGRSGASFGRVTFVRGDFWPHNAALFVKDFKGNNPLYIRYLLEGLDFSSLNSGSAQQSLNRNFVYGIQVVAADTADQSRIAAVLGAYDDLVENNLQRIQILDEMARAIYREWFVRLRFPGRETSESDAVDPDQLPTGWVAASLGDIAEEVRRNVPKGKLDEALPYVGLEHIPRRSLALDSWEMVAELGSNKLKFEQGEVLFGKIRPYFHKVAIAPFDGVCSADTIVLQARLAPYKALMAAMVSSDEFVAHASATANGAKMPRANWAVLAASPIRLPPVELAATFGDMFLPITDLQQVLVRQIANLRATRDLLLPRLMSGRLNLLEAEEAAAASL